jgi:hypothetical protein
VQQQQQVVRRLRLLLWGEPNAVHALQLLLLGLLMQHQVLLLLLEVSAALQDQSSSQAAQGNGDATPCLQVRMLESQICQHDCMSSCCCCCCCCWSTRALVHADLRRHVMLKGGES